MASSCTPSRSTGRASWAGLLVFMLLLVAVLGAKAALATSEGATPASDVAPLVEAAEGADAKPPEVRYGPSDGVWLTDEDGTRYWIEKIPKGVEGRDWMWVDDEKTHIRIRSGLVLPVVEHDEGTFSVRLNEIQEAPPRPPRPKMTEEEREQIAATYETEWPEVDLLRLERFDRGLPRRGQWRQGFEVADMNRDGFPDIIHGPSRKGRPQPNLFLGDGKGNWRLWQEARFTPFPYEYGDIAVADFNGDGHQDLALGMHLKGLVVLLGDGKGRFVMGGEGIDVEIPGQGGAATTFSSRAVAAVDWNADGHPDILALGEGAKGVNKMKIGEDIDTQSSRGPLIYLNQGDDTWSKLFVEGQRVFGDEVALGDFNGDQHIDFLTATSVVGLREILNIAQEDGKWQPQALEGLRPSAYVRAVATGRINDDAREDLVIGYSAVELGVWRTGVDIFYSTESGWERRALAAVADSRDGIYSVATGDLDGNGHTDVVATSGSGDILVFLGTEENGFVREMSPELDVGSEGCHGYAVRLANLDGDAREELIIAFAGEGGVHLSRRIAGCRGGGSLRVWRSEPMQTAADSAASP